MAQDIKVTATTAGTTVGPFTIRQWDSSGTILASDVSRAELVAGYTVTVGDTVSVIWVGSEGLCNTTEASASFTPCSVVPTPTPTPTVTPTPTATPVGPTATPTPTPTGLTPTPTPTPSPTPLGTYGPFYFGRTTSGEGACLLYPGIDGYYLDEPDLADATKIYFTAFGDEVDSSDWFSDGTIAVQWTANPPSSGEITDQISC